MQFEINPNSPNPIYRQIVDQLRRLIVSGQIQSGQDIPSVRAVALEHAINPMTVSKAYSLLETEGLLERRRGLGMVVAASKRRTTRQSEIELLLPSLKVAAQIARQLRIDDNQALAVFKASLEENPSKDKHDSRSQ